MDNEFWKLILSSAINDMFYNKKLNLTEQDNLLFSLECFIDENMMDFDSFLRTGGKVNGENVLGD